MPSQQAVTDLPFTPEGLQVQDTIMLSDIGANEVKLKEGATLLASLPASESGHGKRERTALIA